MGGLLHSPSLSAYLFVTKLPHTQDNSGQLKSFENIRMTQDNSG